MVDQVSSDAQGICTQIEHTVSAASDSPLYLCPSDRAARAWRLRLLANGRRFADCISIEHWMAGLWSRLHIFSVIDDQRELIDSAAMSALWYQIVSDASTFSAPECARVARLVEDGWTLAVRHGFPLRQLGAVANGDDDVALFAACVKKMQGRLAERNALSRAELPVVLSAHCRQMRPYLPSHIVLTPAFSFDPAVAKLWDGLRETGIDISKLATGELTATEVKSPRVVACAVRVQEINSALEWAEKQLLLEPPATVALIVPDLAMHRATWLRALRSRFSANAWWNDPATDRDRFNLSLGDSLDEVSHIASLLLLLRACTTEKDTELLAQALLHPRWGRRQQAQRDISRRQSDLLERGIDRCMLADWAVIPALADAVAMAAPLSGSEGARPAPRAQHRSRLQSITIALTESTLLARTDLFQLDEAWLELLDRWQQFDRWLSPVNWSEAIAELSRLAAQTPFQPKSGAARLQIMGLLESAGVPLDAARIVGLNDRVLPERLKPHPMLPRSWQASHRVGLGSADEVDARAARLWQNWLDLCADLSISFSLDEDGTALRLSPLAAHLPLHQDAREPHTPGLPPVALTERVVADEQLPERIASPGSKPLSSRALEDQAQCPRRAAAVRLKLNEWPEHAMGIPARIRGTLIHAVLAAVGAARMRVPDEPLRSNQQLIEVAQVALDACITEQAALRPRVAAAVWHVERARVMTLVDKVLSLEQTREGFNLVAVEAEIRAREFEQDFRLRVDRVDQSTGGGLGGDIRVVFDYKTGKVSRGDWFAEGSSGRLAAPQLPLYALILSQDLTQPAVRALGYIVVGDDDDPAFVGVGDDPAISSARSSKNDPPWDQLAATWQDQLGFLVTEIQNGVASVAPLKGRTTCRYCAFGAFCREPWSLAGEQGDTTDGEIPASEQIDG